MNSPDGVGRDADGYVDLRSYAVIGDGRTIALIVRDGRIDWLPLPDLDRPPVFGALLDSVNGGHIALAPVEEFRVEREYVENTNVLTTTFTTASGSVRVTDSLNTGVAGRLPWAELARRIDGITGEVELAAVVRPGTRLNTASPWFEDTASGPVLRIDGLTMSVRLLGESDVSHDEQDRREIRAKFVTSPRSRQLLGLVATEREPLFLQDARDIDAGVDRTIANWTAWMDTFGWDGPWQPHVRRSALMLKTLIYAPTGAVAAAATTSLPESLGAPKNWDYRFAWSRDMAYSLQALFRFGLREETHGAISWLMATIRRHGPDPRIFYCLDGSMPSGEVRTYDVPGWREHGPVVSGNAATDQLQLGVFGDLFSVVRLYVENGNVLDAETGRTLAGVADTACDAWQSKDSGMWELHTEQHYATSKMGCWKALTDAVALAELGQIPGSPERWRHEAERIRTWIDEHVWSEQRQAYVWYPGSDQLDASVLLHAISGFDRGARMSSTLDALRNELGTGPHLYRFSGAAEVEGTFVACSFWMVSALALVGRRAEAEQLMAELVEAGNDVGVFSEMIDPASGDFLGNLPQALSHLALMHAATTLAADD